MIFKPTPNRIQWESLFISGWIVIIDGLLLLWAMRRPVDWLKFALIFVVMASLPFFFQLLYRTWAAFTLEYWVDRNSITITWANVRQLIPIQDIRRMAHGGLQDASRPRWNQWPADNLRMAKALGSVDVQMMASQPLDKCLLLETSEGVFAVSPADADAFIDAVQEHYQMEPAQQVVIEQRRTTPLGDVFERDRIGLVLLGVGFLGVLALIGLLMVRYPGLPGEMIFRYSSDGLPLAVRGKNALFLLPAIGLLAWLINGVWGLWMATRKELTGAYLLWGGAIVVQICSLLALVSLMP